MGTLMERLTTSEAAVAAGVSIPQIHRIIDEKILPETLYSTAQLRTFRTDACILIAFYFETAEWLTAQARLRTIRDAMAHCGSWEQWKDCIVEDSFITIRFLEIWKGVEGRLLQLAKARQMVIAVPNRMILEHELTGERGVRVERDRRGPIQLLIAQRPHRRRGSLAVTA